MARRVETTLRVNASAGEVWEVLRVFSGIERFSSKVETVGSPLPAPAQLDRAYT